MKRLGFTLKREQKDFHAHNLSRMIPNINTNGKKFWNKILFFTKLMQFCEKFVPYLQNICLVFAIIMDNKEIKYKAKINVLIGCVVFLLLCMFFMAKGTNDFYKELYYNTVRELEACNYERLKAQERNIKQ